MVGNQVVIIEGELAFRKHLKAILSRNGYQVVGEAEDGLGGLRVVRSRQPDLVILNTKIAGIDALDVAKVIYDDRLAPVLMITTVDKVEIFEKSKETWAFGYVVRPVDQHNLLPAVRVAIANYRRFTALEREVADLKDTLETRKIVDRAKGILMETQGVTEGEAFRRIQRQSMNRRTSMKAIAEALILAHDMN